MLFPEEVQKEERKRREMEIASESWLRGSRGGEGSELKIASAVLAVLIGFYFNKTKKRGRPNLLPPGPRGIPVLGSLPFLGSDLHVCFKELADVYGPVLSLRLGSKLCVVLSSPEAVREALKDQDVVFASHDVPAVAFVSSYGCKSILWAPYGTLWRLVRKVTVRELLSSATIDGLCDLRRAQVRRMEENVRGSAGKPVNLREVVSTTTMNMTTEMLWGGSVAQNMQEREAVEREFREATSEQIRLFGIPNISDFFPALAWLDLQGLERRTKKLRAWFGRILDGIIEERLRMPDTKPQKDAAAATGVENSSRDFLQVLLDLAQKPDPQPFMTGDVIKAILLDLVLAGTDTTSTTVEWAMAELLQHPQKMKRAKEEIAAVVEEGGTVEEDHIPRLKYLDAVVRETLRLHPVLPLLVPHRPSSTCTIAGYTIPEGTKVFVNAWAIQRDPGVWEDASDFKPERFLLEAGPVDHPNTFRYLPFGAGRRICAGVSLGERMATFILASLLRSFDWAPPQGGANEFDLKEKFGLVMRKEKDLIAIPTPR